MKRVLAEGRKEEGLDRKPNDRIAPTLVVAAIVVLVGLVESGRSHGALAQTAATDAVPTPTVLVPFGADWKYLDDGSNQAVDWRAPGFDDASWAEGPAELGYGDADEVTVVGFGSDDQNKCSTTYFRHAVIVDNASDHTNVLVRLVCDDGEVVYLNGSEVFRINMPGGVVGLDTLAFDAADYAPEPLALNLNQLLHGTNIVAVEIHQGGGASSDLIFDLMLEGEE